MPIYWTSGNQYTAPTGTNTGAAIWNYEFSIDVNPGGQGTNSLGGLLAAGDVFSLTITDSEGDTGSVNPLTHWGDDSGYGHAPGVTMTSKGKPEVPTDWVAQNSENLILQRLTPRGLLQSQFPGHLHLHPVSHRCERRTYRLGCNGC